MMFFFLYSLPFLFSPHFFCLPSSLPSPTSTPYNYSPCLLPLLNCHLLFSSASVSSSTRLFQSCFIPFILLFSTLSINLSTYLSFPSQSHRFSFAPLNFASICSIYFSFYISLPNYTPLSLHIPPHLADTSTSFAFLSSSLSFPSLPLST